MNQRDIKPTAASSSPVTCASFHLLKVEGQQRKPFWPRVVRLHNNPLIMPLMPRVEDPVGQDLVDIPTVLQRISDDWDEPSESLNRITAWTFVNKLKRRMRMHARGDHDGSLDLLITGCEVSLWLGEQFAADLHMAFPHLRVSTISANKVLGLLGQTFPVPQAGYQFTAQASAIRPFALAPRPTFHVLEPIYPTWFSNASCLGSP